MRPLDFIYWQKFIRAPRQKVLHLMIVASPQINTSRQATHTKMIIMVFPVLEPPSETIYSQIISNIGMKLPRFGSGLLP